MRRRAEGGSIPRVDEGSVHVLRGECTTRKVCGSSRVVLADNVLPEVPEVDVRTTNVAHACGHVDVGDFQQLAIARREVAYGEV